MARKTVRRWIIRYIGFLLMPLFLVIAILFSYAISGISNMSVELSQKTMQLYVSQLEESINNMERILITIFDNNIDLAYLCVSGDRNQLYMSKLAYSNYLNREILIFDRFNGMFTLVDRGDEQIYFDAGNKDRNIVRDEIFRLKEEGDIQDSVSANNWFVYKIGDRYYLMRIVKNGSNYCGAWICLDSLAAFMKESCDISAAEAVVTNGQGEITSSTVKETEQLVWKYQEKSILVSDESGKKYTVGSVDMFNGMLYFYLFVPTRVLLREVNILWGVLAVVLVLLALLLLIFWMKIRKKIIEPCVRLSDAMERIETQERLFAKSGTLWEFEQMHQGFNRMKEQIYTLKIEQYEQQIREQQIHMEYLFGQIQPHFFLNTLNVIYSFAEIERFDLIQKMVLAMVRYLRYVFNNGSKPIALREELSHVEDFITIQQIRYPDRIFFKKEIDKGMEDIVILPFLIQTFAENSIKYGLNEEGLNEIYVGASLFDGKVQITVADTGKGFSEDQIREMNRNTDEKDSIYKVGIRNTRQRLQLMYGKDAEVLVGNKEEGGAIVQIRFPVQTD